MVSIATNIRFPIDEYQELKLLAFSRGESLAKLIREAASWYKKEKFGIKERVSLAEKLKKLSVKINIPVIDLVKEGRKF